MSIGYLIQQIINSLCLGSIYGLLALGYTMVYGILGIVNFAHGDVFMIAAYTTLAIFAVVLPVFAGYPTIGLFIVCVLTLAFSAGYGFALERVAYRPIQTASKLAPLIAGIGASIFLQNGIQLVHGAQAKSVDSLGLTSVGLGSIGDFHVRVPAFQIVIFVLTGLVLAVLWLFITKTHLGRAQRACSQDMKMSALLGVDVSGTIAVTFATGSALAGFAAYLITFYYGSIDFHMGFLAGLKAFTAAVLGGIGSLPGAVLGGLVIGLVEGLWASYLSGEFKEVGVFLVLIALLVFRPQGLLGRPETEKV